MTNGNKVYVQRIFECSSYELFNWLTKPALITQWFGPEGFLAENVSSELIEGGKYSIDLRKDDLAFTVTGEYLEIRYPEFLSFSYRYIGLEGRPPSTVTFKITEVDEGHSKLHMVQEFDIETPDFNTRTKAWNFMLDRLADLV